MFLKPKNGYKKTILYSCNNKKCNFKIVHDQHDNCIYYNKSIKHISKECYTLSNEYDIAYMLIEIELKHYITSNFLKKDTIKQNIMI